ncbi:MAG: phosphatidylglycerophosphatase A, partial [Gammaproteobacteria bacterium]|nr:phosphatidylglycerophosphatase A [Gammaproteobacteria bacterium]
MRKPELAALKLSNPLHLLALGFGTGLSPVMPGTMGTLAAIPLYLLIQGLSPLWYL